ncbi:SDR family oxidoreductase [Mycolicibacterium vanbaalenii]|jgi:NAD(P)-dependent dehydrogenase (short-subunit alcohol dehydrogenase family)|uniref:SDR family NAD(P)-dependent oxidoreductase n=1 Tax=Mycolicibacterium vanbaalenii TaxID=110539 RepID=UPI001F4732F5|nr:SDR family NAD(P)-dependent oxidoreductase [Mycolicibacterium vanbaalenii]UJL29734.1 SDR family oxidoreductase [Mycolicibacterium vanbaalenii]WND57213.1 SDR family NAD(P)-dependent oxidoreductase [Mycolicibacterium vanbaalenii]
MNTTAATLSGRTALVTGSTSGLGAGIAEALADAGAHVVITGRTRARGEQVVTQIESQGGRAVFVPVDFAAGPSTVTGFVVTATEAVGGRLDILVNNVATLVQPAPTADVTAEEITTAFGVSVATPFLLTGLIAPAMVQRGDGAIVNIGSISGIIGAAGSALYGATKASVHLLTKAWAAEYGPSGVRVNAVAPGPIATERTREFGDAIAPVLARVPSHRMSTVAEVASAVVFLAGPEAANIHGTILSVDGGATAV